MYSILYKHAISACVNYVYRQKLHTSGLLDCFHVAFSLVLLQQKIMWDEDHNNNNNNNTTNNNNNNNTVYMLLHFFLTVSNTLGLSTS